MRWASLGFAGLRRASLGFVWLCRALKLYEVEEFPGRGTKACEVDMSAGSIAMQLRAHGRGKHSVGGHLCIVVLLEGYADQFRNL